MQDIKVSPYIKLFIIITCLLAGYFAIKYTIAMWYPLAIAIAIAYISHPLTTILANYLHLPRLLAAIVIVTTIFLTFTTFIGYLFFELIQSMTHFLEKFPEKLDLFFQPIFGFIKTNIFQLYERFLSPTYQQLLEQQFEQVLNQLAELGLSFLQSFVLKMIHLLALFPYSFMILIFILIATILMTNDWLNIEMRYRELLPESFVAELEQIIKHFKQSLINYFRAQLILVIITAFLLALGLIILQVDHIITFVFFTAMVDLLPIVGTAIIFIPWLIYLFIVGKYSLTIGVATVYVIIIIVRQIIEPKIVSTHIGIRPLTVLISLFFSFQLFGAIGVIFAPIIMILGHALYEAQVFHKVWQFMKS